jgi:hypothetical protein
VSDTVQVELRTGRVQAPAAAAADRRERPPDAFQRDRSGKRLARARQLRHGRRDGGDRHAHSRGASRFGAAGGEAADRQDVTNGGTAAVDRDAERVACQSGARHRQRGHRRVGAYTFADFSSTGALLSTV